MLADELKPLRRKPCGVSLIFFGILLKKVLRRHAWCRKHFFLDGATERNERRKTQDHSGKRCERTEKLFEN